jgi:hypothetical protein
MTTGLCRALYQGAQIRSATQKALVVLTTTIQTTKWELQKAIEVELSLKRRVLDGSPQLFGHYDGLECNVIMNLEGSSMRLPENDVVELFFGGLFEQGVENRWKLVLGSAHA